jgi:hypothetical protein
MIASSNESQLRHCLNRVRFPASKDDLVEAAINARCDDDAVDALRALEPMTYTDPTHVVASATIVQIPGDGGSRNRL